MKALCLFLILASIGCSSKPVQPDYNGALAEIMRNGVPQTEMYPEYQSRVSHTCTSTPIYDLEGYYVRHDVRCY